MVKREWTLSYRCNQILVQMGLIGWEAEAGSESVGTEAIRGGFLSWRECHELCRELARQTGDHRNVSVNLLQNHDVVGIGFSVSVFLG
jgi:hypothetical protein